MNMTFMPLMSECEVCVSNINNATYYYFNFLQAEHVFRALCCNQYTEINEESQELFFFLETIYVRMNKQEPLRSRLCTERSLFCRENVV